MGQQFFLQLSSEPADRHARPDWFGRMPDRTNRILVTAAGVTHRSHFAVTETRRGCIDLLQLGRSVNCTLPSIPDHFPGKCAGSRQICIGVATARRKAAPLPAGGPTSLSSILDELPSVDLTAAGNANLGWRSLVVVSGLIWS